MSKSILVPVDGSAHSRKALEFACDLANSLKANVRVLHVALSAPAEKPRAATAGADSAQAARAEPEPAGAQVLEMAQAVAVAHRCRIEHSEVARGDPAQVIVSKASEYHVDMIVMGSRGIGNLSGLLLGSVSHKVNQLAACTCITVR